MSVTQAKHWMMPLIVVAALTTAVQADRRSYVWTYEYLTMPAGSAELEYYLTHKVTDWKNYDNKNSWEHAAELEYGLTAHWDIAVYQTWLQSNSETEDRCDYTGSKLRTRYRIGEKNDLPVDVALYAEYILGDGPKAYDKFEGKLILAKDLGQWNVAYNQVFEKEVKKGNATEHGYAAGLSYEISPTWKVGLESTGNYTEDTYHVGPTVSWASEKIWSNLGVLGGLNDRSKDIQVRLIVGFPF